MAGNKLNLAAESPIKAMPVMTATKSHADIPVAYMAHYKQHYVTTMAHINKRLMRDLAVQHRPRKQ